VAYKDYYAVLGVSQGASDEEVNAAYRKLARKFHPDISKLPDAEARFKELGEAYDVLRDAEKRKLYDQYGEHWKAVSEGRASPAGGDRARVDFRTDGFNPDDLGDLGSIFEQFFGGGPEGRGGRSGYPRSRSQGIDTEAVLELSVEEAFAGGERSLSLQDPNTGEAKRYSVKIPAGVRPGQRIRLAGQGRSAGGQTGDLFLVIAVVDSDRFELRDTDVHTKLDIAPWEAALGCTVKMPVLGGHVKVKVPAGSSSGREIRLSGKGYPRADGTRGDFYAEIRIRVPTELSEDERTLWSRLAEVSSFRPRPVE
jgi:curved DNA-binding protein